MKSSTATAFLLLGALLGAPAAAGALPKAVSLVERHKSAHVSHFVRGPERKLPGAVGLDSRDRHRIPQLTHAVRAK